VRISRQLVNDSQSENVSLAARDIAASPVGSETVGSATGAGTRDHQDQDHHHSATHGQALSPSRQVEEGVRGRADRLLRRTRHRSLGWPGCDAGCYPRSNDQVEVPDAVHALEPEVVDAVWKAVEALSPTPPADTHSPECHRPRVPDRVCFHGILVRLLTGCAWVDVERLVSGTVSDTTLASAPRRMARRRGPTPSRTRSSPPTTASSVSI
jgi:hypothetical protein